MGNEETSKNRKYFIKAIPKKALEADPFL